MVNPTFATGPSPLDQIRLTKAERHFIQTALDERERAAHFRLKAVKRSLERKREIDKLK